ncbi:MAG: T9SS type A sorting domain-containing protein, partial [Bacteroidetes bacterium]|nr:T9SS type A sorting domain-containing protein [Bacteroidota bacterium]
SNGMHGIRADSLSAGPYSLTVTDNVSGCTKTIPFTISEPPSRISSVNVNPVSCNGLSDGFASISITGNQSGILFSWSNGNHTNSISNIPAGSYFVSITNEETGCVEDTVIVLNEPPAMDAAATVAMPNCGDANTGKIQVSVSGGTQPYQYSINSGTSYQGTAAFQNLQTGTYDIIIRDAHYCTDTLSNVEISSAHPLNGLQITATGQTMVSPYSEPNSWYVGNNPIPVAQGSSHVCNGNETYHVTGIDVYGCLAKSADYACITTDIDAYNNLPSFSVYPSPSHGDFLIDFSCRIGESYSISIADNTGKRVSVFTDIATVKNILRPVSLNDLGAGTYYVTLEINGKARTKSIEVIR